MHQKNLVLGAAGGYNIEEVQTFICSFRKSNPYDDIILLTDDHINSDLQSFFKDYAVKTAPFLKTDFKDTVINNSRFIEYIDIINQNDYKNILLTDVRDVVFQANPFDNLPDSYLYLFSEDPGVKLGNCSYNSYWVNAAYGLDILQKIADHPVICCGTILGSKTEILDFLHRFRIDLESAKINRNDFYSSTPLDQGITNYIGRTDVGSTKPIVKNNGDIVGTIGVSICSDHAHDQVVLDKGLISVNGMTPAIVHQYDRSQILSNYYLGLYSSNLKLTTVNK